MNIAKYIDHTILKPEATVEDVKRLCREAKEYNFASVCVNGCYAKLVSTELAGSEVKTCVVVGFPLGAMTKEAKAFETSQAIENGASEIDMVINVGALKSKDYKFVKEDIEAVVNAAKGKALVKVIIETCLLTDEEKVKACEIAKEAKADFVKTSTGFSTGGATKEDIALMRKNVGPDLGVKASGGVRDFKAAMEMINAGASRIGSSNSIAIVNESK
ncbi:deoxyribose-phosphate aldolase [Clostridium beijerinckii]|uniref:Deoxyribose-phosphate aldolase n=1 Tax=Clostridium beijerinckii TaxID=1520 RepID=A0A9Q5CY23_CLOBE|nr:deoxyribose-phosphate aldolase [Clostridium beijerinckii]AQS05857.1 deoxyribose-phosphate aldolase 1 [Clostridium beijerinckii]MBA2885488.1 deoxyribose-phosphate aldolase [Clostridium beijerinckii]MBA2900011.1 deoxyribose-phosphate aldolase [Clostridium beijerinckii]MBA2909640.1 deoxyribose-phosphate aldolase [Clostridium beijerinckii]MBA9014545.1 deoxyribose-phosphate aldolase [Clostridium beijerinckii]